MGMIYDKNKNTLVNPIDWSGVDRCMLGALAIAPWYFMQAVFGSLLSSNPELVPFFDTNTLSKLNIYLFGCGCLWLAVLGCALYLRRNHDENKMLEWVVVLLPIPLVMPIVVVHGILTSSVLAGTVAVAMLGFFFFETRLMVVSVVFNIVLVSVVGLLAIAGAIPFTSLYENVAMGPGAYWWMVGQFMITMYPLFCGILMTMFFLKGLHDREDKIRELSRKDGLTNIWNRRYLMEIFERELHASQRSKTPISFIMIDLDFFKKLNDQYGHKMGDRALEVASKVLQTAIRSTDSLGRYGGEEFAAVLPDCTVGSAREVAERCRVAIESSSVEYNGVTVDLTASVGATTVVDSTDVNADTIIDRADQALYKSKDAGRNRVSFFIDRVYTNLVHV